MKSNPMPALQSLWQRIPEPGAGAIHRVIATNGNNVTTWSVLIGNDGKEGWSFLGSVEQFVKEFRPR